MNQFPHNPGKLILLIYLTLDLILTWVHLLTIQIKICPQIHMSDRIQNAGKGQAPQTSGSKQNSTGQNHINTQILPQLNALGARLDCMENSMKRLKKTNDSTKIKRTKVKTKDGVAHVFSKGVGVVSPPVQTVHNIPPPSRLREEARKQEIQNRLRHFADNVKPGMGKIKSQRGGGR